MAWNCAHMRIPAFGRAAAVFTGALLPRSALEKATFAALTERPIGPVMLPTGRTCQPVIAAKPGSTRPTEAERATPTVPPSNSEPNTSATTLTLQAIPERYPPVVKDKGVSLGRVFGTTP